MSNHPRRPRSRSIPILSLILALTGVIGFSLPAAADSSNSAGSPGQPNDDPIDLALYGRLLEEHTRAVDDLAGVRVNYQALATSKDWQRLTRQVHTADPTGFSRDAKLAFWINAYNILTIDLIVQHYPIKGIKKIGSFFSSVWNIEVASIAGRRVSLGDIEHEILRKMGEPFIHGAIVCASASCPPLARSPFRPDHLQADLADAMKTWLGHREKGMAIDRTKKIIRLSKVFDWFEADFDAHGGVLEAIADVMPPEDAHWIRGEGRDASIRYFDYDWSLNDLK